MSKQIVPGVSIAPRVVASARGDVEYDLTDGAGPVVLSLHAGLGGVDQGRLINDWLVRNGYRVLSFSRPGYLGTPLTSGETFEEQADLLAALLDVVGIERGIVTSLSAGGPAAYMFAAKHPERTTALLAISSVSGDYVMPETVGPVGEAVFMSSPGQKAMRLFMNRFPRAFLSTALAGIGYLPRDKREAYVDHVLYSPEKLAFMHGIMETMYPYGSRKAGNENDMRQFRAMKPLPFDEITCPTLVIHGTLDADVKFYDGVRAWEHISSAEHFWIEDGDHLAFWLSPQASTVRSYALDFLRRAEDAAWATS
jgi:Predicted hydrolases or acyltransferases (alpha/beta hydrolase superfamily)